MSVTNHTVRARNQEAYATRRGRKCAECGAKIAYDQEPGTEYCGLHQHFAARDTARLRSDSTDERGRGRPTGIPLFGLQDVRKRAGLSQGQLSRLTGISPRTISHYERGASGASLERAHAISQALGVTVEELV